MTPILVVCKLKPQYFVCDVNNWLNRKDPDGGKDRGQKSKRVTEDEMVG